jgi:hypothetical protein
LRRLSAHAFVKFDLDGLEQIAFGSNRDRHCEQSEAIQGNVARPTAPGSPRRHSPSKDGRLLTPYGFLAMTIPTIRSLLQLPDANFPYADFAVKHFPDNTARRSLFDHQRKTLLSCFFCIEVATARRRSIHTKNVGDG